MFKIKIYNNSVHIKYVNSNSLDFNIIIKDNIDAIKVNIFNDVLITMGHDDGLFVTVNIYKILMLKVCNVFVFSKKRWQLKTA